MDALATNQAVLISAYDDAVRAGSPAARSIRNEIITRRMYAIDVQYTQYETALTRERQEVGFGTLTTAEGLSTAATLVVPAATKTILSGLATATIAVKGHYDSEILLAQTMRTIQKQMRASRNIIATNISAKMAQSVADYPLWAALSDVEDYYNAGTLTTGIIDASTTVGIEEKNTKEEKTGISQLPAGQRPSAVLRDPNTPIPRPFVLPASTNPAGEGFREQRLTPRIIRQLQRVVCLPEDATFTPDLRRRVIAHLNKIGQKDRTPANLLSTRDVNIMQDEADNNVKDCQP
jgi:hypothetical protein